MTKEQKKGQEFIVVVPAAGVGKRMQANCPKQYLTINGETILSHTVTRLLTHPNITHVVLAVSDNDQYFAESAIATNSKVIRVSGGSERVDSVLNGLKAVNANENPWVLVHDAARPCITHADIDRLIAECLKYDTGGILATPVRDTMKRGSTEQESSSLTRIKHTVEREQLWHALTPQLYKTAELRKSIEQGLSQNLPITDEASAMEYANINSLLVTGSSENIKITHPDDLALAEFYLQKQKSKVA